MTIIPVGLSAQDTTLVVVPDTTFQPLPDSLRKKVVQGAALRSAVIPGWGQLYNKKYWKAPIAFGAVGTGLYFLPGFARENANYKEALILRLDGDSTTVDEFSGTLSIAELLAARRMHRSRLSAVLLATLYAYALNITDAFADASIKFTKKDHHPEKAGFYSAMLPGAGQLYNRKYWKIPIVFGALGASVYFIKYNTDSTQLYSDTYVLKKNSEPIPDRFALYETQDLLDFRNFYKNQLNISYIACGVVYILNILDAVVDAHLYDFDISDDLSLSMWPELQWRGALSGWSPGLRWRIEL
jgi:hypothetical protein